MKRRTNSYIYLALITLLMSVTAGECRDKPCRIFQKDRHVVVDCSHVGLTSLPKHWPAGNVTEVDLSHNALSSLQGLSRPELRRVRHLNVSYNSVPRVDGEMLTALPDLGSLDLSHNQLGSLQPGSFLHLTSLRSLHLNDNRLQGNLSHETFRGLSGLQKLDLSHNLFDVLVQGTFSALLELTWLSVRGNRLLKVEAGALDGLSSLQYLDLSENSLQMTSSALPPGVFSSLSALQELRLQNNDENDDGDYPPDVFNDLPALRSLTIDTFYQPYFGQNFTALKHLEILDLSINCKIGRLTNETFYGFQSSSLKAIYLRQCKRLTRIELCTFCNLPNLKILQLRDLCYLHPYVALKALYGLQNQTMELIDFWHNSHCIPDTYIIDKESTQFLVNICVSNLQLYRSKIRRISKRSFGDENSVFSNCIEHINVATNSIGGDALELMRWGSLFPRLQTLELQNQMTFSVSEAGCYLREDCYHRYVGHSRLFFNIELPFSPALRLLNMSGSTKHFSPLPTDITVLNASNLRALDMSYNNMANCRSTLHGLSQLETLKLDFNYCYNVSDTILDNLPNLKHLSLSNFGAPNTFYVDQGKRFFQNLHRLEELDLSLNRLLRLPADMLQAQRSLTHLRLSSNRFQSVPVGLGHHNNLTSLDLSSNMLSTLTAEEREALDRLAEHHQIRLSLLHNPLTCTCNNLDLVHWLWTTRVTLDGQGKGGNFSCTLETGETTDTQRVMAAMLDHWRNCVGTKMLSVAIGLILTQLLVLSVTYLVFSQWSRLRYAWQALRRHHVPNRLRDFAKDANLVYANTDRDVIWACVTLPGLLHHHRPELRLLLSDVEPLPSMDRAQNIVHGIDVSWKTVLLVTADFSQDDWACGFAVQQATRCISDLTPERVIVVFLDRMPRLQRMPSLQRLLPLVHPHHVFHAHPLAPRHLPVWRALADAIVEEQRL